MSAISNSPSATQPPQKRHPEKSCLMLAGFALALVVAVVAVCYFGFRLFQGPQAKPGAEIAPRKKEVNASSKTAAAPAPKQIQTTLAQIAKVEAAKQGTPGGPLYDARSSNVALSFAALPLDAPEVVEAQAVLTKYLLATANWRDRLPYVFEPERVEALLQEQYEKRAQPDPEHGRLMVAGVITAGSSKVLNLQFACATRPDAGMRANFHRTRSGKLLLDWESWVAWSGKPWTEFKQERSQLPVLMRAIAAESDYYNYEFSEKWRWLAVRLRSPDGLHNVTGYVARNSLLGLALANLIGVPLPNNLPNDMPMPALKMPGAKALVTLRLAFPNQAQSDHCVKITDLLADRWLLFPAEGK
ncbi:MAG: hypothetical protein B7Z37_30400 [Verrucomicrobia bacterium 12-59-8]|nr:MAG: hypothetical protein B7Z37_30400 [Verrucomicrobia bacterium 12-59-8]